MTITIQIDSKLNQPVAIFENKSNNYRHVEVVDTRLTYRLNEIAAQYRGNYPADKVVLGKRTRSTIL